MHVSRLFHYPVKSLPGLAVDRLALDEFGPAGDRRWMIVDPDGKFITQRKEPRLALVSTSWDGGGQLVVQVPGQSPVPLTPGDQVVPVTIWGDSVTGRRDTGEAARLLGDWLGREVELVYMGEDDFRPVNPKYTGTRRRVSFADGFPFLIASESSLQQLDEWTGERWDMRRFRPGIVIAGSTAFAEDQWRWLRIGDAVFQCVKPCSRCIITTIDPDSAKLQPQQEPLRTLGRHRRSAAGVIFGQNAVHWRGNAIAVGDDVELLDASPL